MKQVARNDAGEQENEGLRVASCGYEGFLLKISL
jgi:hypothetical protein